MAIPYRLRKGSWQPARLRKVDHTVLNIWLIAVGWIRGIDYASGDDKFGARNFMFSAAPGWVWGYFGFILGSAILTYGALSKRHLVICVGHYWVGVAYAVNSLALILAATSEVPTLDGIRGAGAVSFVACVHFIAALRMGFQPLRLQHETASVSEHIAVVAEGNHA